MTSVELRRKFQDISPEDLRSRNIRLLTVDVENVLTDRRIPDLMPGIAEHTEELLDLDDLHIVLLSNSKHADFLQDVASRLPGKAGFIHPLSDGGLRPKPWAPMFKHALKEYDTPGEQASHVDDQVKAYIGAFGAGFQTVYWTKPVGEHEHLGVKAFRPVEFGLIRPSIFIAKGVAKTF